MLIAKKPEKSSAMNYIGYEATAKKTSRARNKARKMQWEYNK